MLANQRLNFLSRGRRWAVSRTFDRVSTCCSIASITDICRWGIEGTTNLDEDEGRPRSSGLAVVVLLMIGASRS